MKKKKEQSPVKEVRFVQISTTVDSNTGDHLIYGLTGEGLVYYWDVCYGHWVPMPMAEMWKR